MKPTKLTPPPLSTFMDADEYRGWRQAQEEKQQAEYRFRERASFKDAAAEWSEALKLNSNPANDVIYSRPTVKKSALRPLPIPSDIDSLLAATSKTRFRVGIEFEGMIRRDIYPLFVESMTDLGGTDDDGESIIQFGVDSSVRDVPDDFRPVEIRTSTLRMKAGIKLFEEMLCFLYSASQTDDFRTNVWCGLHINVSEVDVFEDDKQVDFYCQVLSRFDESSVLATFDRLDNKYCRAFFKDGAARDMKATKHQFNLLKRRERDAYDRGADKWCVNEGKYLAVSLRDSPVHDGFDGEQKTQERIEFRCIGNADYHLRFDELDQAINHMLTVCRESYREVVS